MDRAFLDWWALQTSPPEVAPCGTGFGYGVDAEWASYHGDSTVFEAGTGKSVTGDPHMLLDDPRPGRWGKAKLARNRARPNVRNQVQRHNERTAAEGLPSTLTLQQWRAMLRKCAGSCVYCGGPGGHYLDHVLPVSLGGGTEASNVVPACWSCNSSKCGRHLHDWLAERADAADVDDRVRAVQEAAR